MLNPKRTENFYVQNQAESPATAFETVSGKFSPSAILDKPQDELDGIEVLVQMAKQGKIDPWNINIADIADKYMLHLAESKSNNLRLSGRALFFLAVLLKLKSNVLVGIDTVDFESENPSDEEYNDDEGFSEDLYYQTHDYGNNVIPLESIIQRRTSIKQNRNRIVTLKDLIRQLEFYERLDKKQSVQNALERAKKRVRSYADLSSEDIINLTQEEYIENSVKVLNEQLIKIFEKEEKVELNSLTLLGLDKISAYMALLFLTVKSDFELVQEEFYSDLYVIKSNPLKETE